MKIAVTGHRPNKLGNEYDGIGKYSDAIRDRMAEVIKDHKPTQIITGMALGVDMLWAEMAIINNIPFIAAIPCKDQEKMWPKKSQDRYNRIVNHPLCTKYYVSEKPYTNSCMQARNVWMSDNCDILLAIWDGSAGGTKNCYDYAFHIKKQQVPVIRINPLLFKFSNI